MVQPPAANRRQTLLITHPCLKSQGISDTRRAGYGVLAPADFSVGGACRTASYPGRTELNVSVT